MAGRKTTQAQRRRIVEVLCVQDGRQPPWLARETARKKRDRRMRQVQVLRLQAGMPVEGRETARPRSRTSAPRRRPPPIDLGPLLAAQEQAQRRSRTLGIAQLLVPRWGRMR